MIIIILLLSIIVATIINRVIYNNKRNSELEYLNNPPIVVKKKKKFSPNVINNSKIAFTYNYLGIVSSLDDVPPKIGNMVLYNNILYCYTNKGWERIVF